VMDMAAGTQLPGEIASDGRIVGSETE